MRYHTLLTELLKCTPIQHPDYIDVLKADQEYHKLVMTTNSRAKQHDLLLTCGCSIIGVPDLIQPWRYCLYYGECFVNGSKSKSILFMFNDRLLWMETASVCTIAGRRTYFFTSTEENTLPLERVDVGVPPVVSHNCIELSVQGKRVYFLFPCKDNVQTWIEMFAKFYL